MEVVAAQEAPADEVGVGDAPTEDFEDFDPTEGLVGMDGMDAVTPGSGAGSQNSSPQQPQQSAPDTNATRTGQQEKDNLFAGIDIQDLLP